MKKKKIPVVPVAAVLVGVLFVGTLLLVVKPKYDEAAKLDEEIAALDTQIQTAQRQLATAQAQASGAEQTGPKIKVADLFRLAKAMPDGDDVPGVVLELDATAKGAGVELLTITPQVGISGAGYRALPMQVVVDGGYFEMADFLFRLRTLVTVRDGVLDSSGRMYTVDTIDVHEGEGGFPNVQSQLTLSAYAYGVGSTSTVPLPASEPAPASTTGADTSGGEQGASTGETTQATNGSEEQAAVGGGS